MKTPNRVENCGVYGSSRTAVSFYCTCVTLVLCMGQVYAASTPSQMFRANRCSESGVGTWQLEVPIWRQLLLLSNQSSISICLQQLACSRCQNKVDLNISEPINQRVYLNSGTCHSFTVSQLLHPNNAPFALIGMACPDDNLPEFAVLSISSASANLAQTVLIYRDKLTIFNSPCHPVVAISSYSHKDPITHKEIKSPVEAVDFAMCQMSRAFSISAEFHYDAKSVTVVEEGWIRQNGQHRTEPGSELFSLQGYSLSKHLAERENLHHGSQPLEGKLYIKVKANDSRAVEGAICKPLRTRTGLPFTVYPLPKKNTSRSVIVAGFTAVMFLTVAVSGVVIYLIFLATRARVDPSNKFLVQPLDEDSANFTQRLRGSMRVAEKRLLCFQDVDGVSYGVGGTAFAATFLLATPKSLLEGQLQMPLAYWQLEKLAFILLVVVTSNAPEEDALQQLLGPQEHLGHTRWCLINSREACRKEIRRGMRRRLLKLGDQLPRQVVDAAVEYSERDDLLV